MLLFPDISESDQQTSSDEDDSFNQIPVLSEVKLEHHGKDNKHESNTNANKYTKLEKQHIEPAKKAYKKEPVMEGYRIDKEIWKYRTWQYNYSEPLSRDMIPKRSPSHAKSCIYISFYFTNSMRTKMPPMVVVERKYKAGAVFDIMSKYPLRDVFIYTDYIRLGFEDLDKTFDQLIKEGKIKNQWGTVTFFKKNWLDRLFNKDDFPPIQEFE
jgi:hypothetical protein